MDIIKSSAKFTQGKQSSLKPERGTAGSHEDYGQEQGDDAVVDPGIRLMYLANEGDLEGIGELLDSGTNVNFRDIDGRTALHVAACQGLTDVVQLLIDSGAEVDPEDRWGSTIAPMHVQNAREVPEYEIDPSELDFSDSIKITKGTFRIAKWRGIQVAIKTLEEELFTDEDKVRAFRDELALLQKIRHPNVVQFLGAVTQSTPMIIVTEYLSKGDLCAYLKLKGALKPRIAVKLALDIARGMNYLHEHKPEAIVHRDLEPSNILRDDSGHLKVADFGVSKILKVAKTVKEDRPCQDTSWRYVAPEVYRNEEYDTRVDVFSFALILQEMIEGCPPFPMKQEIEVPKAYAANERPPFNAPAKCYAHGLKELIEECWSVEPFRRPTFREIIARLDAISYQLAHASQWKNGPIKCLPIFKAMLKRDRLNPSSYSSRYKSR